MYGCPYFLKTCRAPAVCTIPFSLLDPQHFVISSGWCEAPFFCVHQTEGTGTWYVPLHNNQTEVTGTWQVPHRSPYFYQRPPAGTLSANMKQIARAAGKYHPLKWVPKVCTISFERPVNYLCDAWHVFPPKYEAWTHFNRP